MSFSDSSGIIHSQIGSEYIVGTDDTTKYGNALPSANPPTRIILREIVSGKKITRIGKTAFGKSKIISIFIPASIKTLSYDAFAYCHSLKRIEFAEGSELQTLEQGAIYNCLSLKEVVIPPSVTKLVELSLGYGAFDNIYYCGVASFDSSINIFGYSVDTVKRFYPKKIIVRETYNYNSFGDFNNVTKTLLCSFPLHKPKCTTSYRKSVLSHTFMIIILISR